MQNDDKDLFSPDFGFIELVNSVKSNSPWKAKAHDHFTSLKKSELKAYLGINKYQN